MRMVESCLLLWHVSRKMWELDKIALQLWLTFLQWKERWLREGSSGDWTQQQTGGYAWCSKEPTTTSCCKLLGSSFICCSYSPMNFIKWYNYRNRIMSIDVEHALHREYLLSHIVHCGYCYHHIVHCEYFITISCTVNSCYHCSRSDSRICYVFDSSYLKDRMSHIVVTPKGIFMGKNFHASLTDCLAGLVT